MGDRLTLRPFEGPTLPLFQKYILGFLRHPLHFLIVEEST
tara:strand:+ start:1527 stop:1646 length:120 start_codon:yes stop_codon:yes gene_type:complete